MRRHRPGRGAAVGTTLGLITVAAIMGTAAIIGGLLPATPQAQSNGTTIPGTSCPAFPADNVWNTPVTGLPVDAQSAAWLAHMAAGSTFLHPDYGPAGGGALPYGIPWQVTSRHPKLVRVHFQYA